MIHGNSSQQRLGFRIHALVFVLTMVAFVTINAWTGPPFWALWVLPGWSVGLFAHWWCKMGPGATRVGTGGRA